MSETLYQVPKRNYDKLTYKTYYFRVETEGQTVSVDEPLPTNIAKVLAIKLSSNLPAMAYNRGGLELELDNKRIFQDGFEAKNLVSGVHVPHDASFFELQRAVNGGKIVAKYTDKLNPALAFPAGGYEVAMLLMMEEK